MRTATFLLQSSPRRRVSLYTDRWGYKGFLFLGQTSCFLFLWGEFIFRISMVLLNCVALRRFTSCILHSVLQPVAKIHFSKHIAIDFALSPPFFYHVHVKLKYLFVICPLQWSVYDFYGMWKLIVLWRCREVWGFFCMRRLTASVSFRVPAAAGVWWTGTQENG